MLKLRSENRRTQQIGLHTLAQSDSEQSVWMLGCGSTCHLVIDSPALDEIHAKIRGIDDEFYFIDAGSGMTAIIPMLRWIQSIPWEINVVLIDSVRRATDILYHDELNLLSQLPSVRLAVTLPRLVSGDQWMGFTGRISANLLQT